METDNFFTGFEAPTDEPAVVEETQQEQPQQDEAPAEQEQPIEPAPPPVEAPKPEPGHVPITALLDEREKRKELERRLAALEEAKQDVIAPDPTIDPYGYQQHLMQQVQQQVLDTRLNMSETAARRHYGDEKTEAAKAWALEKFAANPAFQAEVLNQPDPYGYAVEAYQRDQIASQVSATDFEQFQAWKAAQAQLAAAPPAAITPTPAVAPPPKSIASAPSAGGKITDAPMSEEEAFAAVIK